MWPPWSGFTAVRRMVDSVLDAAKVVIACRCMVDHLQYLQNWAKYFSGKNEEKVCCHVAVLATLEDWKHKKEPIWAEWKTELLCHWKRQNPLFVFEEISKVIITLYSKYVLIFILKKVWIVDIFMFQSESVFLFTNCICLSDTTLMQAKFFQYFCYRVQCLDHTLSARQLKQQHPFSSNNWSKNCRVLWLYFMC
jgi:hypothetical protein